MFKRIKKTPVIIMSIVLAVILVSIATAYSILRQNIGIKGTVKIKKDLIDSSGFLVTCTKKDSWYNESKNFYNLNIEINNNNNYIVKSWSLSFLVPTDVKTIDPSSVNYLIKNSTLILSNVEYNGNISPKKSVLVSYIFSTSITANYIPKTANLKIYTDEFPNGISFDVKIKYIDPSSEPGDDDDDIPTEEELLKHFNISYNMDNSWTEGEYIFKSYIFNLKNTYTKTSINWSFDISNFIDTEISNYWNVNYVKKETVLHLSNVGYNGHISPNSPISFGIIFKTKIKSFLPVIENKHISF